MPRVVFPRKFSLETFVEGTLETEMEMASAAEDLLPEIKRNFRMGLYSSLFTAAVSIILLGSLLEKIFRDMVFVGLVPGFEDSIHLAIVSTSFSIYLALNLFSAMLLFQGIRFHNVLTTRLESVNDLLSSGENIEPKILEKHPSPGPLESMRSFTDDIFSQSGQLWQQSRTSLVILFASSIFMFLAMSAALLSDGPWWTSGRHDIILFLLSGAAMLFSAISAFFIQDNKNFFQWLEARNKLVKNIADSKPPRVSENGDLLARFEKLLAKTYGMTETKRSLTLHGRYGVQHRFDLYAKSKSAAAYVRLVQHPSPVDVEKMAHTMEDILRGDASEPETLLVVLLCDDSQGGIRIDDDTVSSIRNNLIHLSRGPGGGKKLSAVHIVLDHGDLYSFVPLPPQRSERTGGEK